MDAKTLIVVEIVVGTILIVISIACGFIAVRLGAHNWLIGTGVLILIALCGLLIHAWRRHQRRKQCGFTVIEHDIMPRRD